MRISDIYLALHRVRKEHGLSQREIADQLSVEQATISLYENSKRSIPLDLLDRWLELLDIEVKITQKDHQPLKGEEETKNDLEKFTTAKKRRNFLIAELRSLMAIQIARTAEFQEENEENGENIFWSYSFCECPDVGIVETRYDHPKQKYLAVEYTDTEVNVYSANRSEGTSEAIEGQKDIAGPNIGRSYLTEDDFLTMGGRWDRSNLDMRKITVLRKSTDGAGETEIVNPEGFSLRVLLDMQQKLRVLDRIIQKTCGLDEYKQMKNELDTVNKKLLDLTLDNRLTSGSMNPQFLMWDEVDQQAIDIPLWNPERNWHWIEEGVEWTENDNECTIEIF